MANPYPLWRVTYEEKYFNQRIISEYKIECRYGDNDMPWIELYKCDSLPETQLVLKRLKEIYYPIILNFLKGNEPIMYEVDGYVYKTEMVLPNQSCIVGTYIKDNVKYGDIQEETIKHDYIQDSISFYYKGHALVVGKQLFVDGELVLNFIELENICNNIGQDVEYLDYNADKFLKFLAEHFDNIKSYTCGGYTSYDIGRYKDE